MSAQDRDLLRAASLRGKGDRGIASLLETYKSVLTSTEFQNRDNQGDLETMVRCIEDGL